MRQKLLSLNFFPSFYPPLSGGEQRAFHLLSALSDRFDVVQLTPTYAGTRDEIVHFSPTHREFRFTKTQVYQEWHSAIRNQHLPVNGADIAAALSLPHHPAFIRELERQWADAAVVVVQHPTLLPAIRDLDRTGKRIVYLSHNCEFELASQNLNEGKGRDFLTLILQLEQRLCSLADHIAVVSDSDRLKMMALYGASPEKFLPVPNGSVSRFEAISDLPKALDETVPNSAVFVGSNWGPNVEAAAFIAEKLAPQLPAIRFSIVGSVCRALASDKLPSNVTLHYEIADDALADLLRRTHIALNPMRSGGGSNVKLADYLAHGLRIVASPLGARGFPQAFENLHIAEMEALAPTLVELTGQAPSGSLRCAWRERSASAWDWREIGTDLAERLSAPLPPVAVRHRHVVLNEFPVRAADHGGEARISGLFSEAGEDEFFVILSFGRANFRINALSERLVCLEVPMSQAQATALTEANRATYASVNDIVLPTTVEKNVVWLAVAELVIASSDAITFSHPFMWPAYEHLIASRPLLHDSHNVEAALKRDALETHRRGTEYVAEVARQEAELTTRALAIAACSEADAAHFRRHGGRNVVLAQNGVGLTAHGEVDAQDAIAHEGPLGSEEFFTRSVYLVDEFDAVADAEFVDTACRSLLKRPAIGLDQEGVDTSLAQWRERLLLQLMESPRNRKRVFVLGLLRRLGRRDTVAVFLGSGHRPNLTAAEVVAAAIAPRAPSVSFLIVGQVGASMDLSRLGVNVFATGFVGKRMKSLLLSRADIGVNPMVGGGGSNLKVPDYLVHGLPVVSSEFGARGFSLGEEEGFFVASLGEFAARIEEIAARFSVERFDPAKALEALRERYGWEGISRRFLEVAREALAPHLCVKTLIVVEDASHLRYAPFGNAMSLVEEIAEAKPSELIVQSDPLPPRLVAEIKRSLPESLRRTTLATRDREFFLGNPSRLQHDNVLSGFLDVVTTPAEDDAILKALAGHRVVAPVVLSGAGNPVEAVHTWRFVTDELVVALPRHTLSLILGGMAHRPAEVEICAPGGQRLSAHVVSGSFEIRAPADVPFVRVRTRLVDPAHDIASRVRLQLNRLAVDLGPVEREGDLWSGSAAVLYELGLPAHRERLAYGKAMPRLSQELQGVLTARAAVAETLVAIGSAEFAGEVAAHLKRAGLDRPLFGFDGTALSAPAGADPIRTIYRPAMSWGEIGLLHNAKERGYLAGRYVQGRPILILADQVNGEILRFARSLRDAVRAVDPDLEVAVMATRPTDLDHLPERIRAAAEAVRIILPESDKATLAVLGAARLAVVRSHTLPFARVPALLATLGVPGAVWRTGETSSHDPFEHMPVVSDVPDVLELLWRERPERETAAVDRLEHEQEGALAALLGREENASAQRKIA